MVVTAAAQMVTLESTAIVRQFVMQTLTATVMAPPQTIIRLMDASARVLHILAGWAQHATSICIVMRSRIAMGMARQRIPIPLMVALVIARKVGLVRSARSHQNVVVPGTAMGTASLEMRMPRTVVIAIALVAILVRIARKSHLGLQMHGAGLILGGPGEMELVWRFAGWSQPSERP